MSRILEILQKTFMELQQLKTLIGTSVPKIKVTIPGLWIGDENTKISIGYKEFLLSQLSLVMSSPGKTCMSAENHWTNNAIVYNLFVRLFTAYDHNQDGRIGDHAADITLNADGARETGTFMKSIAMLPYLKKLGINTIHLLPITEIGIAGRKGDLGSPYAIKNPFKIDPLLADPLIPLSVEEQFKAFVDAAHFMGFRIVQEFIFRTAAIDSDWQQTHPEWFYWINDQVAYGPPEFTPQQLEKILKIPSGKGKFIPPPKSYKELFVVPPLPGSPNNHKIASAFADWPPNDLQPPWSDVTYLRLYKYDYAAENNFNYIAYNTIRYYDPELAKSQNIYHELWEQIAQNVPYYQQQFNIDGAMIDMGHALPAELKDKIISAARLIDPEFGFWDENFSNKEKTKIEGYNAVIGGAWHRITKRNGFKRLLIESRKPKPLPFFGGAETHNTPRFGFNHLRKKKAAWLLFNLLPDAIPFLHNGFELHEQLPVNTGLNFTKKEIDYFSSLPLPLFNKNKLNWDTQNHILPFIKTIRELREIHPWIFDKTSEKEVIDTGGKISGLKIWNENKEALALFNLDFYKKTTFQDPSITGKYVDLFTSVKYDMPGPLTMSTGALFLGIRESAWMTDGY